MKDKKYSDLKNKPMIGVIGLLTGLGLLFWPQPKSNSQTAIVYQDKGVTVEDSLQRLKQLNDQKDSLNLVEARNLIRLTRQLNRRTRRVEVKVQSPKPTVALRYGGDIYETQVDQYKNYLIVDVDSFLEDVKPEPVTNEFIDTSFIEPPKKRTLWQKIWHSK